jgi:pyrroloquinoline quinone biosynthesis protein B
VQILVLGSAAGGGFPQWNCNCANCRRARSGDPGAPSRTQSSLAVSADGERWLLLNASPDLRQQIGSSPALHPRRGARHSPIAGVVLSNGDVDHVAGLLTLRENQALAVYASERVQTVLRDNAVFNVLNPAIVARRVLSLDQPVDIADSQGSPIGLRVTAFAVPGKVALYMENEKAGPGLGTQSGDTIGLEIQVDERRRFFYLPACAALSPDLSARLRGAPLLFFDGTLWQDDEMISMGVGSKTGRRMGHMSISGEDGSLAALAALGIQRRIYVHINNTNPILIAGSPERLQVEAAGWEVAYDGMETRL